MKVKRLIEILKQFDPDLEIDDLVLKDKKYFLRIKKEKWDLNSFEHFLAENEIEKEWWEE